jgi:hypothetical protein
MKKRKNTEGKFIVKINNKELKIRYKVVDRTTIELSTNEHDFIGIISNKSIIKLIKQSNKLDNNSKKQRPHILALLYNIATNKKLQNYFGLIKNKKQEFSIKIKDEKETKNTISDSSIIKTKQFKNFNINLCKNYLNKISDEDIVEVQEIINERLDMVSLMKTDFEDICKKLPTL